MKLAMFVIFSALAMSAWGQGGPPMITDDPDTVGANKWEVNIAQLTLANSSTWFIQNPYFDINYGVGDQLQFKYESGVSSVINTVIPYGGSYATAGVRWKFYEDEESGVAVSTYPQDSFYPGYFGKNNSVNTSQTAFFLPFEFKKKFGPYTLNPEVGYNFVTGDQNSWSVGVLLGREMSKTWSVMTEIHAQIPVSLDQSIYILNLGTAIELNESLSLLGSVGTSFATTPWFWVSYLALQLHF